MGVASLLVLESMPNSMSISLINTTRSKIPRPREGQSASTRIFPFANNIPSRNRREANAVFSIVKGQTATLSFHLLKDGLLRFEPHPDKQFERIGKPDLEALHNFGDLLFLGITLSSREQGSKLVVSASA